MRCEYPFFILPGKNMINRKTFLEMAPDLRRQYMPFPCGRCLQCRINKARCWTTRNILEASVTADTCFVTLTYDDDHLPPDGCLQQKKDLTPFFKSVRHKLAPQKLRYFAVGEYGENTLRPHYHLLLYGISYLHTDLIKRSWKKCDPDIGIEIGYVQPESIRYCTEYCVKKWDDRNERKPSHLSKEFFTSSRGPSGGIGAPAIYEIAKNMRKQFHLKNHEPWNQPLPHSIRFQGKKWPLDRYMKNKLWDFLKVTQEARKEEIEKYGLVVFDEHAQQGYFDLNTSIKIKNKEIAEKWNRKYYKRMKIERTI